MKQLFTIFGMCSALVVASVLAGCTAEQGETTPAGQARPVEHKGKIGVTCMDLTDPFFKLIGNVMEQEAKKHGYSVVVLSGEMDPAKQNSQLSDFAAQGYDAVFLNPVDSKSAGEGVKKLAEAGIPVFTYDVQVTDEEAMAMARRLAAEEGIFAGFSSGANLAAAMQLLRGPCRGATIAILMCDSGLKYLSTDLWDLP